MKLTNVIVTGFGERCNLAREGKMFAKDEVKISRRGVVSSAEFCILAIESNPIQCDVTGAGIPLCPHLKQVGF